MQLDVSSNESSTQTDTQKPENEENCDITSNTDPEWLNFPFLQDPKTMQQLQEYFLKYCSYCCMLMTPKLWKA